MTGKVTRSKGTTRIAETNKKLVGVGNLVKSSTVVQYYQYLGHCWPCLVSPWEPRDFLQWYAQKSNFSSPPGWTRDSRKELLVLNILNKNRGIALIPHQLVPHNHPMFPEIPGFSVFFCFLRRYLSIVIFFWFFIHDLSCFVVVSCRTDPSKNWVLSPKWLFCSGKWWLTNHQIWENDD